jgi:predicted MPP superfamily phosphohydrolase
MNVNKIAWLTDIHLNFLEEEDRKKFYENLNHNNYDTIVITGDIAEGPSVCDILIELSKETNKTIYFILGNHDYYFSSVAKVRENIERLCSQNNRLIWLGKPAIVQLNNNTALIGHDGWADARYGDFDNSPVNLNDSRLIAELFQARLLSRSSLKKAMQQLADVDASIIENALISALASNNRKIIMATHVPPFPECCLYEGKQSDKNWLPYFSSKATGDVIFSFAVKHPEVDILVLCGHTHGAALYNPLQNLEIKCGKAIYYKPELLEIIDIHGSKTEDAEDGVAS